MEKGESKRWTTLKSEYLVKRPWLTARRDMVQLPNGVINDEYYVLEYPDWVNVIAITADGQFVFVRQYRYGLGIDSVELCAGVAEPGETPEQSARRELQEETGYGGGKWTKLIEISQNPVTNEVKSADNEDANKYMPCYKLPQVGKDITFRMADPTAVPKTMQRTGTIKWNGSSFNIK